jgi:hypothetical protein
VGSLAILVAAKLGYLATVNAARVAIVATLVVAIVCIGWWIGGGPRHYLRDRVIVLSPLFLVAGPGLIGVNDLGGGAAVAILSGALGFTAAAALGLAWSARRRS